VLGLTALYNPATTDRMIKKKIETKTYSSVEYISESDINHYFFLLLSSSIMLMCAWKNKKKLKSLRRLRSGED
jgi:hypothetical protein